MYKTREKIKDSFTIAQMVNQGSIDTLNSILGTHYIKARANDNTRILRDYKNFKFWDRLMRKKPGFESQGNHHER